MSGGAWLMLLATWSVVLFFTSRFFWRVLTLSARVRDEASGPGRP